MGQRFRSWAIGATGAVVLAAMTTAGCVALAGGLAEQENAAVLSSPQTTFISTTGTVTSRSNDPEWSQVQVSFSPASGREVQTMVWTKQGTARLDVGDFVPIEYAEGHPAAARLAGGEDGTPRPMGTIMVGAAILAGSLMLASAWAWDLLVGAKRRAKARAGTRKRKFRQP